MLPFLISERRDHTVVELLNLCCRVLTAFVRRWTLRSHFSDPRVLDLLLLVQLMLLRIRRLVGGALLLVRRELLMSVLLRLLL